MGAPTVAGSVRGLVSAAVAATTVAVPLGRSSAAAGEAGAAGSAVPELPAAPAQTDNHEYAHGSKPMVDFCGSIVTSRKTSP